MKLSLALAAAAALAASGCARAAAPNYGPDGPRYAGVAATAGAPSRINPDTIKIVSFNIEFAYRVDSALVVLADPVLRDADILLLQEMDAPGTKRIADAMGMSYVYYPATRHPRTRRDFGNAVLSRWPIIDDRKIVLPHIAVIGQTERIATGATIRVGDTDIRVYSAHLGTVANITFKERLDQMATILADADRFPRVILGGDMNDPRVGPYAREHGYGWPTERGERTATAARLDHVFLKGIGSVLNNGSGTITDNHHASDHRPIWALAVLR